MEQAVDKYVFWGAGTHGELAAKKYEDCHLTNESVTGFVDRERTGKFCGYLILKETEIDKETVTLVITVDRTELVAEIYEQAKQSGYKKIYWFTGIKQKKTGRFLLDYCVSCLNWGELVLSQAEIHVADYCNLNCRGCAHYSPIFKKELPDKESRINDIRKLKSKFSHIIKFFLMGGEPFLNPDIISYIQETRKILPDTMIQIVTNGLLIPKLSQEIWDAIHENQIVVSISEYEPTHRMIDQITAILEKNDIVYMLRPYESKTKFIKPLSLIPNSKYEKECISNGCINIWNGKIARCPNLMYIDRFNEVFQMAFPNQGIYDLDSLDGREILWLVKQEIPLCSYCIHNEINWGSCGKHPTLYDFAVED